MNQLADAQDQQASVKDSKGSAAAEAKASRGVEQLQLKLQKLMERRKQTFDLMSNISEKFNEMAKTAIQNLGRS